MRRPEAPGAAELVHELAGVVDVLVENFRPGVLGRLGVTWEALSARNPRLVMASISGFGQEGPHAHRPAYASVIPRRERRDRTLDGARSAHADRSRRVVRRLRRRPARDDRDPRGALLQARATGVGDHIDIAMLDAMLGTDDYIHHAIDASSIRRLSGEYWKLADGGYVIIPGYLHHVFKRLADLYGARRRRGGGREPRGENGGAAGRDRRVPRLLRRPRRGLHRARPGRPSLGRAQVSREAIASPTARHRGTVAAVDDGAGGTRGVVQLPYRFRHSHSGVRGRSAALGEHNAEVLHEWLGLDGAAIERLASTGVLRTS